MDTQLDRLVARLREAEADLARDVEAQQRQWHYRLRQRRVRFARDVRLAHRRLKQSIPRYLREASLANVLTAPLIYSMLVPFVLLDVWVTLYQWVCLPIYGIPCVPRATYFVIDRHKLGYLNGIEKANCVYCGYANGLIAYAREVTARTEQYWCPIKHASRVRDPHAHYHRFVGYGDAHGYHGELMNLRRALRDDEVVLAASATRRR